MAEDKAKVTDEVTIAKNDEVVAEVAPLQDDPDREVKMTHPSSDEGDYAVAKFSAFQEVWEPLGWTIVDDPVSE